MATLEHLLKLDADDIESIEQLEDGMVKITFKSVMQPIVIPMSENEYRKLSQRFLMNQLHAEVEKLKESQRVEIEKLKEKHRRDSKQQTDRISGLAKQANIYIDLCVKLCNVFGIKEIKQSEPDVLVIAAKDLQKKLEQVQKDRDNWRREAESKDAAAIHSQHKTIETLNARLTGCRKSLAGLATMFGTEFPDSESETDLIHRLKGMLKTLSKK